MTVQTFAKFTGAIAILCGTIIGVGIFGLPYVAWRAGVAPVVAYLAWGTFVATTAALIFGELIARTPGLHRQPGYIRHYLGRRWGRWAFASALGGLFGGQLVYLLVGGRFLQELIGPARLSELSAVLWYAGAGALLIAGRNWVLARAELILLPVFLAVMGFIVVRVLPFAQLSYLDDFSASQLVLPYGVVMFSLWGSTAVAECREYLGQRHLRLLLPAIVTAFPLCAFAYAVFTIAVAMATGPVTTPDALGGLRQLLGNGIVRWFYAFGFLTTFTSYISFGRTLRKVLAYDGHWPAGAAWLTAAAVPLLLYFSGLKNFLLLMGLIGAITLGFDTISLLLAYQRCRRQRPRQALPYRLRLSPGAVTFLIWLLAVGMVGTVVYTLAGNDG